MEGVVQVKVFSRHLIVATLLVALLLWGCTGKPGKSDEEPQRAQNTSGAVQLEGPFDLQPEMTLENVEQRIGKPDKETTSGGTVIWYYEKLGLQLNFFEGQLAFITQTKGRITPEIAVGDDESVVERIGGKLEGSKQGIKDYAIVSGDFVYMIIVSDGKVIRSTLSLPAGP